MIQLRLGDIPNSILSSKNKYESGEGIKTVEVSLLEQKDNFAFFVGDKDDNSQTLFFAIQPDKAIDHWVWCCPNEEHMSVLTGDLQKVSNEKKPSQDIPITHETEFKNVAEIEAEIQKKLGSNYEIERYKEGETTLIIIANGDKCLVFIGIKPSIRFRHWYLLYPSIDQINTLTKNLKEHYSRINANNEKTRWK